MRSTVHSTGFVGCCCICAFFLKGASRYGSWLVNLGWDGARTVLFDFAAMY